MGKPIHAAQPSSALPQHRRNHPLRIDTSIAGKLIFQAVLVSVVTMLVSMTFVCESAKEIITERTSNQMLSEAAIRGASVESTMDSRSAQARMLADDPEIEDLVYRLKTPDSAGLQKSAQGRDGEFLHRIMELGWPARDAGIENVVITDDAGGILFSLERLLTEQNASEDSRFVRAISGENFAEFGPSTRGSSIYAAAPVNNGPDTDPIGAVIITSSTDSIDHTLLDRSGLGNTGEVYLVDYNYAMISESRFIRDVQYIQTVYTLGAKNCVERMEQTVGTYPDYRGIQILGATYCADGFVLLAEIDEEEMLEPVQVLQESMLVIGSAIVPAMAAVAFVISRKISGPIVRLRDAANQIESGRLDVVTGINSADEVGQLSSAFDSMAGRLRKQAAAIRQKEDVIRYEEGILLKFSDRTETDCVCLIDIVDSTKTVRGLSDSDAAMLYETFLNEIAQIVTRFNGIVIKNIGDSLLFSFVVPDPKDAYSISDALECCISICESHGTVSDALERLGLPRVDYRISIAFGTVRVASSSTSVVRDIFGSTVNRCSKINRLARPNGIVSDGALYKAIRSIGKYEFEDAAEESDEAIVSEYGYDAYHVTRRDL